MAKSKGVYKRGNVWWIRYAAPDGDIRYESSRSASYQLAQELLIKRKREVIEGKDPGLVSKRVGKQTFRELADYYLEWAKRQKSYYKKKSVTKALVLKFGNIPLKNFNSKILEEYQSYLLAQGRSPATANRHIAVIKHMFTKAVEWEVAGEQALKKVRKVKLLPENNSRLRYLSKEECQALISVCMPHLKPIVITALNTGMRKGEILSLEWEKHIDLKHGFVLLDITKNGERREIPINQTLKETLQKITRRIDSPYVFIDKEGNRYKDIKKSYRTALKKAGIKDFRFHDLRHTFASQLVMAGVDITTIKELLGHKSLTMTLRYSHLAPSHKVNAVAILENALGQNPTIQKLYN